VTIDSLPRTSRVIEDGIAAGLHLGGQVYVSREGKVVADDAIGESRAGTPMTRDSMIVWFSMTKATVATSVAQLWQRGLIDLDAPLADYVPEFAANGKERVTIRHCLTHTGGFREGDKVTATAKDPEEAFAETVAGICAVGL
jgi:CubicO group peptidase (beta-lactamase class C family)